jgi:hypothetical protein
MAKEGLMVGTDPHNSQLAPQLIHHPGLSNEDYHHLKAVSPSQIKVLARSPLHYFDKFLAEDREKKPPTDAMLKGTALHTAILEPELWDATIAVPPHSFDRRTKVGKELAAEFERNSVGKIVLSPEDADEVRRMADAVRKHPAARFLLELPGRREASYTWTDPATGLECKTRPDWHSDDRRIVLDVKTAADASRPEFSRSISNYDYHVQAAWNLDAQGGEMFLSLVVENARPYAVAVYPASDALLEAGRRRIRSAMEVLAECWRTNTWPGYGEQIQEPIDLPAWNRD